jgi:hypothetical protein
VIFVVNDQVEAQAEWPYVDGFTVREGDRGWITGSQKTREFVLP